MGGVRAHAYRLHAGERVWRFVPSAAAINNAIQAAPCHPSTNLVRLVCSAQRPFAGAHQGV